MKKWDEIRQKCPNLYKNGIVFECSHGWYDIINDLSVRLEEILSKYKILDMYATKVKEKYGSLRFYMSSETEEMSKLIEEAEILSSKTCDVCGEKGIIRDSFWMECRCDKCLKQL